MTYEFCMGQLRLAVIALISFATGKGWISSGDATSILSIAGPVALLAAPVLWSWSANWRVKYMPHNSIAISKDDVVESDPVKGQYVTPQTVQGFVKVVGALLLAILLSPLVIDPASAQIKLTGNPKADFSNLAPKPATADAGTSVDNAFSKFNTDLQKITKEIVDKAIADVGAALDDANKHNDQISAPCWQSNLDLLRGLPTQWETPPSTIGIALGIQIQRDLLNSITGTDAKSLKVACAALWGDQLKIVANVAGLLGIRLATGGLF